MINNHGNELINFLLEINLCIANGRIKSINDYTIVQLLVK